MKISYRNTKNVDVYSSLLMTKHAEIKILPPTVLNTLHSTDVIPHCTDVIPCMYWCYPPMYWIPSTVLKLSPSLYWCYPPLYWRTSTVLKVSPTVLKLSPTCTAVIPSMYWTTSNVLNNLDSTEPTLYGVIPEYVYALEVLSIARWKGR